MAQPTPSKSLIDFGVAHGFLRGITGHNIEGDDLAGGGNPPAHEGAAQPNLTLDSAVAGAEEVAAERFQSNESAEGYERRDEVQASGEEAGSRAASIGNTAAQRTASAAASNRRAPHVVIPRELSRTQYYQAKYAVVEYEKHHHLTKLEVEAVPQRAAISQKAFVGTRKLPVSVSVPEPEMLMPEENLLEG